MTPPIIPDTFCQASKFTFYGIAKILIPLTLWTQLYLLFITIRRLHFKLLTTIAMFSISTWKDNLKVFPNPSNFLPTLWKPELCPFASRSRTHHLFPTPQSCPCSLYLFEPLAPLITVFCWNFIPEVWLSCHVVARYLIVAFSLPMHRLSPLGFFSIWPASSNFYSISHHFVPNLLSFAVNRVFQPASGAELGFWIYGAWPILSYCFAALK